MLETGRRFRCRGEKRSLEREMEKIPRQIALWVNMSLMFPLFVLHVECFSNVDTLPCPQ